MTSSPSSPLPSKLPNSLFIRGGRIVDPSSGRDETADLLVLDGRIAESTARPQDSSIPVIEAKGLIVAPGLIDMHVHLREPGGSQKETIATGTRAAAAGGFTSLLAMPNTTPPADGPNTIALMRQRAAETACVNVFTTGCITVGMKGEQLAPIGSLLKAGVVALTDDGHCVQNNEVMRRALDYARMFDLPILDHCQDYNLSAGGVMHEGHWSTVLGLTGWPRIAEDVIVARNILLAELTGARVHMQHLSSANSVRLVREAKQRGIAVSAEAMPHHIALTDAALEKFDANFKMNPPLREQNDIDALLAGLADGAIEILASDHAPHAAYEKEVEFAEAPFGIVGLETELGIFAKVLVVGGILSWPQMLAKLTVNPARLLHLGRGTLAPGAVADITLIHPNLPWKADASQFHSLSRNTPFHGWELPARATHTIIGGHLVWSLEKGFADR
ncbi:MAG TPA: dihydroorotase [Candidatus Methylacidiphilales bacterium]|nr:dihydroorotase [Candidatus Methylacidiphilales bacterium]